MFEDVILYRDFVNKGEIHKTNEIKLHATLHGTSGNYWES